MKKIAQGRYELSCTKEEAIERFQEMAGICREHISDDRAIAFYCTKKGEIAVSDPPRRARNGALYDSATTLYGQIVEEKDETYLTYYTTFSKFESVMKVIYVMLYMIMGVFAIAAAIANRESALTVILCVAGLVFLVRRLYIVVNEKSHAWQDSEVMINVLKERVNAVNRWDE